MPGVKLALPLSHFGLKSELAGSLGGHFLAPHVVTAEPHHVPPPKAVVYLNSMNMTSSPAVFFSLVSMYRAFCTFFTKMPALPGQNSSFAP
jgi:hypothetical protein